MIQMTPFRFVFPGECQLDKRTVAFGLPLQECISCQVAIFPGIVLQLEMSE